ncbi:hypothetical protein [Nocardia cyriacigeorgica]|uniref:hypothetical protein n=1 Tax=Nocardia cyriacigeorgica TaxID=135487 RepID=UPI0011097B29|nr:hypothetical protein [Nocardia cyriacigeorgica]
MIMIVPAIPAAVSAMTAAVSLTMTSMTGPFDGVDPLCRSQRDGCRERGHRERGDRREGEEGSHGDPGERAPGAAMEMGVSAHRNYLVQSVRRAAPARLW